MKKVYDLLSGFKTLKEYTEFLSSLTEKQQSGHEISRGMDQHDQSKQQKQQVVSKEVKKHANGSSTETHYDHIDPMVQPEMGMASQSLMPGQQVNIGNKKLDAVKSDATTVKIDISGKKDKINLKPRYTKNPHKSV